MPGLRPRTEISALAIKAALAFPGWQVNLRPLAGASERPAILSTQLSSGPWFSNRLDLPGLREAEATGKNDRWPPRGSHLPRLVITADTDGAQSASREYRPTERVLYPVRRSAPGVHSCLYEFNIQRNRDFLANQESTGFQRRVPVQAEVFAVDLGGC